MNDTARPARAVPRRGRHPHDDAPDTSREQALLATLSDGADRELLTGRIVRAWLPMARRLARRYQGRGEDAEDLEQVAALGLTKAVLRFRPERGNAFESYAVPMIVGEIKRHFRDCTWDVHVPRRVQELRRSVREAVRELDTGDHGGVPGIGTLSAHTGLTPQEVRSGLAALECYSVLSLDSDPTSPGGGHTLLATLGSVDPGFQQVVRREAVRPGLDRLAERQRRILYLRFYCDMTQRSIADQLEISQMHVSRLLRDTCEQLRREVEEITGDSGTDPAPGTATADRGPAARE
ncbi:SigB/SigF/SigG family RNA polymerase sigma factor [Streptomyces spiramenti]|uniref:SigB/SigF/SigG family RNA polymerase sigma factor n=1 Tax=Streptomyces spiramenti TaxID=2720606 RepID=A0ABX1AUI4_9ACTN|nr:SigB/SigF/SigG family RNA polymerase sigma factor [Streptomyces spiramenti]NJP68463.1 SigB/SigF/SigG family RNA polymerase sigma factor [Streptomyces spiramenti]